jgi:uncharacterized protein DUF6248
MTPAQAAWVRAHAWRECHRETVREVPSFYSSCSCKPAVCQYCQMGKHRRCTHERHAPIEATAGYLTDRGGYVKAQVWEVGHRHVWTCSCKTAGHDGRPTQLALF